MDAEPGECPEPDTHCPASKAADLIGDKWVLQIVRAMLLGARRYSDLAQAIPRISPAVLSARLKTLCEQGIIVRREGAGATSPTYRLTPSGRELQPIVEQLAVWGMKWAARNVREGDVDIGALMWDLHRCLAVSELPDGETVIRIGLKDAERYPAWWIVAAGHSVDLCCDDPGKDVDVYLTCGLADLIALWRGEVEVRAAVEEGTLLIDGPRDLVQSVHRWFPHSPMAAS
ncbi:winged helix-turn-helix transcriptional regulator [Croceicoccus bisphenolivorans]|uniref:winged helix-turn-helix transcriptional regulator n=1 Tax=Croceicoccus bisphenolivorans TaxID=1783232 RepID=UPI0008352ACB|nr:helix-turn-helix domain-containing protein [Croceicoccus bisphenolivorans]